MFVEKKSIVFTIDIRAALDYPAPEVEWSTWIVVVPRDPFRYSFQG